MAKDKKSVVDAAIDAAEEALEERALVSAEEPAESVEPAELAEKEPVAQEAIEEGEKEPASEGKDESQKDSQPPPQQDAGPTFEPPQFWAAEKKALFAKAPKEVQQAVLEYEQARNEWASRIASESARGREIEQKLQETLQPFAKDLQESGIADPLQAVGQLLQWNQVFEKNPLAGILGLMQDNGISPEDLQAAINSGQLPNDAYYSDPRLDAALQAANEAKELAAQQAQWIQQQQESFYKAEVLRFKDGKDSAGNVRRQFAEMYAPQISQMAQQLQSQNPALSLYDALNQSYESVLENARKVFGGSQPQNKSVVSEKALAASSSVKGGPTGSIAAKKPKPKTIDEALDMAEEALGVRS